MTEINTATSIPPLKAKDFATDQDVRWCPGCGDYSILKQVQSVLAEAGLNKDNIALISGIGCSSRFPYYLETYGMHSIHGRALPIASGLKLANKNLDVFIVTGDGDGLSIGGNHMIHTLRRNFNVNILLFNNQIYGLTKGQYSPTSELNKLTKSTPLGSLDYPINPLGLAMGSNGSFIARSMDRDPIHLKEMIRRSYAHKGTSFLEIYQNCNIFNDGAFFSFTDKSTKHEFGIYLEQGKPLVYGNQKEFGIKLDSYKPELVNLNESGVSLNELWIHDEQDLFKAQLLTRFFKDPRNTKLGHFPRPFGVIYQHERPTYEDQMDDQEKISLQKMGAPDLDMLIKGTSSWEVK